MIYFKRDVDLILKAKDDQVALLLKENDRLRQAIEVDSKRANNAVDRLLSQVGVPGIVPAQSRVTEKSEEIIRSIQAAVRVGQDVEGERDAG